MKPKLIKSNPKVMSRYLLKLINEVKRPYSKIVILCIGTDRVTGDCIGPLLGTLLVESKINFEVIGTLSSPVHAINLNDVIKTIDKDSLIIAVDACFGLNKEIGGVLVHEGNMYPGKGIGKTDISPVGDISVQGVVASYIFPDKAFQALQDANLNTVYNIVQDLRECLKLLDSYINHKRKLKFGGLMEWLWF